MNLISLYFI